MKPRHLLPVLWAVPALALPLHAADVLRRPVAGGVLYPADSQTLLQAVDAALARSDAGSAASPARGILVPAGAYAVCADTIGRGIGRIPTACTRIIVLGPWHPTEHPLSEDVRDMRGRASIPAKEAYLTPLGEIPLAPVAAELRERGGCFAAVEAAHLRESAVEVLLPFLQRKVGADLSIVPVILDHEAPPVEVADALMPLLDSPETILVVAADLASRQGAVSAPLEACVRALESADRNALESQDLFAAAPLRVLVELAVRRNWRGKRIDTAADTPGARASLPAIAMVFLDDPNRVALLHAAAEAEWKDPGTAAAFRDAGRAAARVNFQGDLLNAMEQDLLLQLARNTIAAKLSGAGKPPPPLYSDTLAAALGCFVTIQLDGKLRGCIGTLWGTQPLATAVQANALSAAFEDKRFAPLTIEELPRITIEISVLTQPVRLDFQDGADLMAKLQPEVHGVVLTYRKEKRSTYLPQVWKQIPDKAKFLANLCHKGGIPLDAWQDPTQSSIEIYEAFTFSEDSR